MGRKPRSKNQINIEACAFFGCKKRLRGRTEKGYCADHLHILIDKLSKGNVLGKRNIANLKGSAFVDALEEAQRIRTKGMSASELPRGIDGSITRSVKI